MVQLLYFSWGGGSVWFGFWGSHRVPLSFLFLLPRPVCYVPGRVSIHCIIPLLQVVALKKLSIPLVMELPTDRPFENAVYIDPDSSQAHLHRVKVAARQAMNAFFNGARLAKQQLVKCMF